MSTSTQLVTPSPESCSPWIPPELVSVILTNLWEAPQTPQERLALLNNIALVNRTWLALVARITSRDIYVSGFWKSRAFLRLLLPQHSSTPQPRDLFTMEATRVANQSCRSLTFQVDGRIRKPLPDDSAPRALLVALELASVPHNLPNLRHISVSHRDWPQHDIFQYLRTVHLRGTMGFPPQVTHLSLDYSESSTPTAAAKVTVPPFDLDRASRWVYLPRLGPPLSVPNLRHLALSGVPAPFTVLMLEVCPNVETLELTYPEHLSDLAPLPPALRTLVLRHPAVALSKREMTAWALDTALEGGLFPEGSAKLKRPQIVVRSGTPDTVSFIKLRRTCKGFNVDLVYERNDARSPSCWDE